MKLQPVVFARQLHSSQ